MENKTHLVTSSFSWMKTLDPANALRRNMETSNPAWFKTSTYISVDKY